MFENVGFKPPKSSKMLIFGINFSQKGYNPLIDFYKILPGKGVPGLHSHAKFDHRSFKNVVALRSQKSPWYFLVQICPLVKILGVDRKT